MLGLHERVYVNPLGRVLLTQMCPSVGTLESHPRSLSLSSDPDARARLPQLSGGACLSLLSLRSASILHHAERGHRQLWGHQYTSGTEVSVSWILLSLSPGFHHGRSVVCPERTLAFAERSSVAILDRWVTRTSNI